MNFREFVNRDDRPVPRKREPEPVEEQYYEEPEEIYQEYEEEPEYEEEYYEEPVRQPVRRVQPQQTYRPAPKKVVRQAMPVEQYNRPIQITKKQLAENTIESTANTLTEAIKRKVDTIFYRFGIQGLEKLDEKILDTIEELQYPEPKPLKKPGVNMRRVPAKRIVRKAKPLPIEDIAPAQVYEKPVPEEIYEDVQEEPVNEVVQEQIQEVPINEFIEEDVVQEPVQEEPKQPSLMDLANQILDIEPTKEMKHEPGGQNPVFAPEIPTAPIMEKTEEPASNPVFDVPPISTPQTITMPALEETKTEQPTEQPKRRRRVKKETDEEG